MKLTDDDRSELLEELLPIPPRTAIGAGDVLAWIENERKAQCRRGQLASAFAAVAVLLSIVALFPSRRGIDAQSSSSAAVELPEAPIIAAPPQPPTIERIDDNALLAVLADTPSALVQWPDGRRSLLVLVRPTEPR
jgi:hypothetical protein